MGHVFAILLFRFIHRKGQLIELNTAQQHFAKKSVPPQNIF